MTATEQMVTMTDPFSVPPRGGWKLALTPDGSMTDPARPRIDNTMVKAIARAFRWRKFMETGVYGTVEEIAAAEKINPSYVSRVLRLTLLAPEIVEAILEGRQPADMTLAGLMEVFPVTWDEQMRNLADSHPIKCAHPVVMVTGGGDFRATGYSSEIGRSSGPVICP